MIESQSDEEECVGRGRENSAPALAKANGLSNGQGAAVGVTPIRVKGGGAGQSNRI
jgi:hypothetical protein